MLKNEGVIITLKDGIAEIFGLDSAASGELVVANDNLGMVLNLQKESLGVVFFTDTNLKNGDPVARTFKLPSLKVNMLNLGNVINGLGDLLTEVSENILEVFFFLGRFSPSVPIELKAPGILARQSVYEPVITGVKVVDCLIPVGQGQRELIIGDRQTGKTCIAVDSVINQSPIFFGNVFGLEENFGIFGEKNNLLK